MLPLNWFHGIGARIKRKDTQPRLQCCLSIGSVDVALIQGKQTRYFHPFTTFGILSLHGVQQQKLLRLQNKKQNHKNTKTIKKGSILSFIYTGIFTYNVLPLRFEQKFKKKKKNRQHSVPHIYTQNRYAYLFFHSAKKRSAPPLDPSGSTGYEAIQLDPPPALMRAGVWARVGGRGNHWLVSLARTLTKSTDWICSS